MVSLLAREGGGAEPALQLLIYPVTDTEATMPSRLTYAEGYILTKADMDAFEAAYLPDGADRDDARVSVLHARTSPRCRPPTSSPPASTRCATRARPTRCGCARPAPASPCAATPA